MAFAFPQDVFMAAVEELGYVLEMMKLVIAEVQTGKDKAHENRICVGLSEMSVHLGHIGEIFEAVMIENRNTRGPA